MVLRLPGTADYSLWCGSNGVLEEPSMSLKLGRRLDLRRFPSPRVYDDLWLGRGHSHDRVSLRLVMWR